ncbi:UDP-N-acetylmuramate dehydrogenase [bacterium]|nr:UDP-N-acetylmuramate dehydrogenase [bacterium]
MNKKVFSEIEDVKFITQVPSERITTLRLGAAVDLLEPQSLPGLIKALSVYASENVPVRVLGAGSNVVLPDQPLKFPLLHLGRAFAMSVPCEQPANEMPQADIEHLPNSDKFTFTAFSGVALMSLSRKLCAAGYAGLEFASGIPASIGGAIRMNAGAHNRAFGDVIESVLVASATTGLNWVAAKDLKFAYRSSALTKDQVAVACHLSVQKGEISQIQEKRREYLNYRSRTQPLTLASAGSVFKNPPNYSAGELLEKVGLKGYQEGGVMFSEMHANWLVKVDDSAQASHAEILVEVAKRRVKDSFDVTLETEIQFW